MPVIIVQRRKALQPVWVPLPDLEEVLPEVPAKQQPEEDFESWTEWYRRSVAAPLALTIKQAKLGEPWASLARGGVALLDQAGAAVLGVADLLRALVTRPGKTLGGIVQGIGQLPSILGDILQVGIAGAALPGGIAASPSAQRAYERLERLFGPQVADLAEYRATARDAAEREALEALQELYSTPAGALGGAAGWLGALLLGSKGIGALGRGSRTALQAARSAPRRAFLRGLTSELNRQALGLGGLTAASIYGQYTGPIIRGEMEPGAAMWEALASGATTAVGVRMFPPLRPMPSLGKIATVAAGEAAVNTLGTLLAHAPRIAVMTGKPEEYPTAVRVGPLRVPSEAISELIAGIALPPALRALEGAQLRGVRGVSRRPGQQPPTTSPDVPPTAPQQPSGSGLPVLRPTVAPVPRSAGGAPAPDVPVVPTLPQRPGGLPAPHEPALPPPQPIAGIPPFRPDVAPTVILPTGDTGTTATTAGAAATPAAAAWRRWHDTLASLEQRIQQGVNARFKPLAPLASNIERLAPEARQLVQSQAHGELQQTYTVLRKFLDTLRPEQRLALLAELRRRNLVSREINNPHEIPLYVTGVLSAGDAETAAQVIRAIREWMRKPVAQATIEVAPEPQASAAAEQGTAEAADVQRPDILSPQEGTAEPHPNIILPQDAGAGQPVAAEGVRAEVAAPMEAAKPPKQKLPAQRKPAAKGTTAPKVLSEFQVSVEAVPHRTSPSMLRKILELAPYRIRQQYTDELIQRVLPHLKEMARELGIEIADLYPNVGLYKGKINPGYQFVVRAPDVGSVERFAAAFGYLARQESVGYHRVEPITVGEHAERLAIHELPEEVRPQVLSQTNAVEIELDHAATVEEVKRLYNAIGRIAQQAGFDRDDLPIIPTRRGLRILNFSKLDGERFVGVVRRAAKTALGKRRIVPLKRVAGDLVSNSWEEHPDGRAYLTKLEGRTGDAARRATEAAAGRTAGSTKGRGTSRRRHLATSEGRPAVSRDFSRVVDIYATEVLPLEERFYAWLRGLRDLAREGKWEQIDPELQPFARKLLRALRDQPAAPGAAATAEAPPSTTTPGSEAQVPAEPQATAQKGAEGAAPVRVRKTRGQTRKKAAPQQAEPAGPEPASAAEAPEQPTAPQPPEPAPTTPAAEEGGAPTGAEAAAAPSPEAAPETAPASGLQPRHKAPEDAAKQRELLAQWSSSLLDNRLRELQEIQNRIRGRQLKANLRTVADWLQRLNEEAGTGDKAIDELHQALVNTLGSLPVEALADPTEVALHWLATVIRRGNVRDALRQDVRDWWSTIVGDENESHVRLRAIEHMREALLRNDQEAQAILDQALPRSTQHVQTLYGAIERYIRESAPGDEVATALRRAFAELPAEAFTEPQKIVSKFMPLVKEYGGEQGLEAAHDLLRRTFQQRADLQHINEVYSQLAGLRSKKKRQQQQPEQELQAQTETKAEPEPEPASPRGRQRGQRQVIGLPEVSDDGSVLSAELQLRNAASDEARSFWADEQRYRRELAREGDAENDQPVAKPLTLGLDDIQLVERAKDHLLKLLAPNVSDALRDEVRYQMAKALGLVGGTAKGRKQRAQLILGSKTPEELQQALGTQWEELSKIVASLEAQTQALREAAKKQRGGKGGAIPPSPLMTPVVSAALAFAIDPDEDYFGIKGEELRRILIGMGAVGLGGLALGMFFRRPATGTRLSGALHAAQHAVDAAHGYLHALRTAAERWVDTQIRQGKIAAARRAEAIAQRIEEAKRLAAEYARGLPKRAGKWLLSVQGILNAASGGNPLAKRLYNALLNAEGIIRGTSVKQELDQWARTVTPELANAIAQEFLNLHEQAIRLAHALNAKELADRLPEEYARSIANIRAVWGDEGAEAYREFLGIARRVGMEHLLGLAIRTGVISPDDADASAVFAALSQRTAQGLPADWGTALVEYLKNKRAAYVGEYEEYRRYLRLLSPAVRRARQALKQNQQFALSSAEWEALYKTLPADLVDRAGGMALSDDAAFIINLRQSIAQLAKQARRRIINVDRLLLYAQNPVPYVPHFWEDHPYVVSVRLRMRGTSPRVQALERRVQALENQLTQAQSQAQPDPALVDALETELQLARQALERARAAEGYVTIYRKTFDREKDWHAAVAELEQLARDPNWVIAQLSKQYDRVAALQARGFQLKPDAIRPEDIIIDTGREAPRTTPTGRLRNAIIQLYSTARRGVYKGAFDVGSVAHALSRMLVPSVPELLKRENVQGWRPAAEDAWRWLYRTFEHMGERSGQRIRSSFIFSAAESVARELAEYGLYHTPAYDYVLGILDRYMVDPTRNLEIPRGAGLRVLLAASTMLGNVAAAIRNIAYATAVSPLVWYRMREGIRSGEFEFAPHPMLSLVLDTHRITPQDAFKLLDIGESSYLQHVRVPGKMERLQDWTYALQRLTERFNNWVAYRIGVATYLRNTPDPDPAAAIMAGLAARRFTTGSYEWMNQPAIERLLRQKVPLGEAFLALFSAARAQAEFVVTTLAWAARSGGMDRLRRLATVGGIMIAGSLLLGPQAYPVLGDLWKLFVELGDKASEDEPPLIRLGGREQWREWVRSIARALGADEDAVQLWADAATYGLISTLTNRNLQAYGTLSEFADILLISQAKSMAQAFADLVKEGKVDPAQVAGLFNVTLRRIIRAADQVAVGQYKSADGIPLGVPYNEDDAFWEILTGRPLTEWKYREITGTGAVPMTAVERQMFISRLDKLPGLRLNIRPRSAAAVALVKYAPEIFTDIRHSYIAIRPAVEGEIEELERFINTREGAQWLQEVAGVAGYDARRAKQFVGQLKRGIKEYYLSLIAHQTLRAYGIPSSLRLEARNGLEHTWVRGCGSVCTPSAHGAQ
jgi:hypothetical protein